MLGYRGTGKSVISKILSEELGRKLYRIDDLIVQKAGIPIQKIVKQQGWPGFRKLECDVVACVADEAKDSVVDCGGGVVLDKNNMILLKKDGEMRLTNGKFFCNHSQDQKRSKSTQSVRRAQL